MNPMVRQLLFFFFVISFIVGAPLLVFYTAGYRYNWQSGTIIRTGVLSISASPRNVQILVENRDINQQTPAVIEQLMPGDYKVTLVEDGYHQWQNTVTVQSNITTYLPLITLWKTEKPMNIRQLSTRNIYENPNGKSVVYFVEQGGWNELWLDDLTNIDKKMIARIPGDANDLTVDWSATGGFLLLHNENFTTFSVYDQFGNNVELPTTITPITQAFWHPSVDHELYLSDKNSLIRINLQTATASTISRMDELGLMIDDNFISLINTATETELRQTTSDRTNTIALLPKNQYSIVKYDGTYLILTSAQNEILIIDLNASEPILFKQSVKLYDYLTSSNLLLWSDGNEINIYNPVNHQTEFITRQGSQITQLQLSPDGNNIFVATENKLLAIDRYKNGEQRYTATLAETNQLQNFWLTNDGKIAFIESAENNLISLYSLQLR